MKNYYSKIEVNRHHVVRWFLNNHHDSTFAMILICISERCSLTFFCHFYFSRVRQKKIPLQLFSMSFLLLYEHKFQNLQFYSFEYLLGMDVWSTYYFSFLFWKWTFSVFTISKLSWSFLCSEVATHLIIETNRIFLAILNSKPWQRYNCGVWYCYESCLYWKEK